MRIIRVVVVDPAFKRLLEGERVIPVIRPNQVFLERAQDALGIGIASGIAPGGKYLGDAQKRAAHHKALRCWLAAVIREQEELLIFEGFTDAAREPVSNSSLNGIEPVIGLGADAQGVTDDFLGAPVKHDAQVQPAQGDILILVISMPQKWLGRSACGLGRIGPRLALFLVSGVARRPCSFIRR